MLILHNCSSKSGHEKDKSQNYLKIFEHFYFHSTCFVMQLVICKMLVTCSENYILLMKSFSYFGAKLSLVLKGLNRNQWRSTYLRLSRMRPLNFNIKSVFWHIVIRTECSLVMFKTHQISP